MNPRPLLEQLEESKASTERLHALLQSMLAERGRFAAHLYQSRKEYRRASAYERTWRAFLAWAAAGSLDPRAISFPTALEAIGF